MEKETFRNIGSKINVFSKYGEWENEYKKNNGVVVCLVMLLGFSAEGWMSAYEGHLWAKGWRVYLRK